MVAETCFHPYQYYWRLITVLFQLEYCYRCFCCYFYNCSKICPYKYPYFLGNLNESSMILAAPILVQTIDRGNLYFLDIATPVDSGSFSIFQSLNFYFLEFLLICLKYKTMNIRQKFQNAATWYDLTYLKLKIFILLGCTLFYKLYKTKIGKY